MARPLKHTVAYFSHDANASQGRTLSILFNHFQHEGVSAWWQLLERVSGTNNHVIDIRNPEDFEFLASVMRFTPERLRNILNKMAELSAIDSELYRHGLIWSQNFVDRLEPVYKYRKQTLPSKPSLPVEETALSVKETELSIPEIPQSKVKGVKGVKESKESKERDFPFWINQETWNSFLEMRMKMKATPTIRARELLIKELEKLKLAGQDPNLVLEQSTMNNWKGVFPIKEQSGGNHAANKGLTSRALPTKYTTPEEWRRQQQQVGSTVPE